MEVGELHCLNCKKPVAQDQGLLFAQVFVCPDCHTMATHFWERLDKELRSLQLLAKESIRLALVEGRFSFPEASETTEVSKREVFEQILRLQEAKDKCQTNLSNQSSPPSKSTGTTPPSAPALDARARETSSTSERRD